MIPSDTSTIIVSFVCRYTDIWIIYLPWLFCFLLALCTLRNLVSLYQETCVTISSAVCIAMHCILFRKNGYPDQEFFSLFLSVMVRSRKSKPGGLLGSDWESSAVSNFHFLILSKVQQLQNLNLKLQGSKLFLPLPAKLFC